ncbi:hypothetical protein C5167_030490 [Papaver somniferum]|uniref:uncharacterized protein LOC113329091 n=1 Tax=Papaver somniferum TaxID=3469 RepID=UPI000E6FDF02|nr:uncharacterized protein LOC113329091 [Papaver somniferum]XP_026431850.1 uncharacterized protein LOC113329092 [Papaver somniferum]RZC86411.1 hypothetical protein C5167_030491 [Papaver somniferum]RZC86412.1 hypothetical protein C5167_030490 [Papaver somniferum]
MEASPTIPTTITSQTTYDTTTQEIVTEEVPSQSLVPLVDQVEVGADVTLNTNDEDEAATPATITTLNDDDITNQEYVEEVPVESRIPPVDGGEVGVVFALNENDEDVHATMASTLPTTVIIQSNHNRRYLRLDGGYQELNNALRCEGDYSFGIETRFELVPSTTATGLFHIRSLYNNKYWQTTSGTNGWTIPGATEPEEDRSSVRCTLFQPVFTVSNSNRIVRLRHVNTGIYVRRFHGTSSGNYVGVLTVRPKNQPTDKTDEFTLLDSKTVVVLPDLIRIKSLDNENHLYARSDAYLDFTDIANNSSAYDYEVFPSRNGGVRLKSVLRGTYWTEESEKYIRLRQASTTIHDTNTVFIPTVLSGDRVLLRSLRSNNLCKRYSRNNRPQWRSRLSARASYPDQACYMEIEEPVDSRTISNVRYRLSDARIYNERTTGLVTDETVNRLDVPVQSELNLTETVTNTTNWSRSVTLTIGVTISGSAGVPFVSGGSFEISTEVANSWDWGETKEESQQVGSVRSVDVPPMTRVRGTLMATRLSYDIPFSYTQTDVLKNGKTVVHLKDDGLFTGHNGYGYYYEIVPLPLG